MLGPREQQILKQGGLARARIAEHDEAGTRGIRDDFQDRAGRLFEVGAAAFSECLFVQFGAVEFTCWRTTVRQFFVFGLLEDPGMNSANSRALGATNIRLIIRGARRASWDRVPRV